MNEIEILGNFEKGQAFVKAVEKKKFLFSFVISYTETCEIPGITIAGADPDYVKFTPPADAEFLHYGYCKCIDSIPVTPDGKPTPAIITKVALETASIPHIVINAGSRVLPSVPYFETGLEPGKNISKEPAMDRFFVLRAIDYGRMLGRTLASLTNCLVIGESIPGGTTTAMAVMKGLDIDAKMSSSQPSNPIELKNKVISSALRRTTSKDPYDIVASMGDPMIPLVAGMINSASRTSNVLLAGGTQMAAVLAFAKVIGFNEEKIALGTTSYIIGDNSSNFIDVMKKISDIPILIVNPKLDGSQIEGLRSFSDGFVKEGAGAGGSLIAAMLKIGIGSEKLRELIEQEYRRITTLRSQTSPDS